MRITAKQTTTKTLADLYRSIERKHAVSVTYVDRDGEETIRTVEIHELRTTASGGIVIIAMCRKAHAELAAKQAAGEDTKGETAERHLNLSGVRTYTLHRIAFVLERPEPTTYERPEPAPADDATALIYFELERDPDDADYRPRRKLTLAV
ncbi:WYL domain-containing protein (plasmid) [Streptomyces sp. GDS52]|uniref:WYL domain-containing protein n=1 Tax=Streptomyces sp. GDS52 TaxID=3406419 RepID=UPI003FCF745B